MRDARTRSASLASIIVKTAKFPDGFVAGFVENITLGESYRTELIYSVGTTRAKENVMHGVDRADISWTNAHTVPAEDLQALGVGPLSDEIPAFNPIGVEIFDQDRGEKLCEVESVLPTHIGFNCAAMTKITDNFSGSGISVRWANEFLGD